MDLGVAKKKLKDFTPQRVNANKGNQRGLAALDKSIRRDGYSAPMIAAADGEIFAGSKRLERAADVFGLDVEPIVVESDGTRPVIHVRTDIPSADDPRAKRLGVADNIIAAADWTPDGEILAALAAEDKEIEELVKLEVSALREVNDLSKLDQKSASINSQYMIVVECDSEASQVELFNRLTGEGLKCRLLIS